MLRSRKFVLTDGQTLTLDTDGLEFPPGLGWTVKTGAGATAQVDISRDVATAADATWHAHLTIAPEHTAHSGPLGEADKSPFSGWRATSSGGSATIWLNYKGSVPQAVA